MRTNWERAISSALVWEGGWTGYRPQEPGGYAMRGISYDTFKAWRKKKGMPEPTPEDLQNHSVEETKEIYRAEFADKIDFDNLPDGYDLMSLHSAIMFGPGMGDELDFGKTGQPGWARMHMMAKGDIGLLNALMMQAKMHRKDGGWRADPVTGKDTFFSRGWADRFVAVYKLARDLQGGGISA